MINKPTSYVIPDSQICMRTTFCMLGDMGILHIYTECAGVGTHHAFTKFLILSERYYGIQNDWIYITHGTSICYCHDEHPEVLQSI